MYKFSTEYKRALVGVFTLSVAIAAGYSNCSKPAQLSVGGSLVDPGAPVGGDTPVTPLVTDTPVIGLIDGISPDSTCTTSACNVSGWACAKNSLVPIQVALYLGPVAGAALSTVTSNLISDPGVAGACGTAGRNYRFTIPIQSYLNATNAGKPITVVGISPKGPAGNVNLINSGNFFIQSTASNAATPTLSEHYYATEQAGAQYITIKGINWPANTDYRSWLTVTGGNCSNYNVSFDTYNLNPATNPRQINFGFLDSTTAFDCTIKITNSVAVASTVVSVPGFSPAPALAAPTLQQVYYANELAGAQYVTIKGANWPANINYSSWLFASGGNCSSYNVSYDSFSVNPNISPRQINFGFLDSATSYSCKVTINNGKEISDQASIPAFP